MSSMFRSLRERNYRWWFFGSLVSNTGIWMQRTALVWIVLTVMTDNDATALGVAMALQLGPQLVLAPFAGVIVDRYRRRNLLFVTQALQSALTFVLFLLVITGVAHLWHMYAFALLLGIVSTVDMPARQTFVSEVAGEAFVPNAVALNSAGFNVARMLGPAAAGLLIAWLGSGPVFLISTVTFAATVGALLAIRPASLNISERSRESAGGALRAGFSYVRSRPDIMVVLAIVFVVGTFALNFNIYTAGMAKVEFARDADAFGLLSSVLAVGSIAGALLAARRDRPRLRFVFLGAGGLGVGMCVAAAMPGYWFFAAALVFVGLGSLTMLTSANAYVQTTTDAHMRGRVMSLYAATVMGGTPIGAPLAGWIADQFGFRQSMAVGGFAGLIAMGIGALWMIKYRHMRLHWRPRSRLRISLDYDGRHHG